MRALLSLIVRRLVLPSLASVAALSLTAAQANASLYWNWNYSGNGIIASGTFSTNDIPDALGFYLITAITGARNGETITALQTTGTPIPGNEPFAVDNLVRLDGPQLTHDGFGYAIAGGTYANPFFADFLSPPGYLEFFSSPPFTGGSGTGDSELPIVFAATLTVPEPNTWALLLIGLGMLVHIAAHAQKKEPLFCTTAPAVPSRHRDPTLIEP
jgi:hypothetical protein